MLASALHSAPEPTAVLPEAPALTGVAKQSAQQVEHGHRGQVVFLDSLKASSGPISTNVGHDYGLYVSRASSNVYMSEVQGQQIYYCYLPNANCYRFPYTSSGADLEITANPSQEGSFFALIDLSQRNTQAVFYGSLPPTDETARIPAKPGHLYRLYFSYYHDDSCSLGSCSAGIEVVNADIVTSSLSSVGSWGRAIASKLKGGRMGIIRE